MNRISDGMNNVGRVLNAIGRAVYLKDIDDRIVYVNDDMLALLGYRLEQVVGLGERDILGSDNAELLAEGAARLMSGKEKEVRSEIRVCDATGTMHLLNVRQRMYEPAGEEALILVVLRDITEERQIEEVLRGSEEFARSFLESSRDCVAHLSTDGMFLGVNNAGMDILGAGSSADLVGTAFASFCADSEGLCSRMFSLAGAGGHVRFEQRVSGKGATDVWLDIHLTPIKDIDGSVRSVLMVGRDITDQRKVETELRKLMRAVEQNPASIVITDTNGIIEYVNPKFCEVTGYRREEAIGQNPRVLKSGEMPVDGYRELWATITAGGEWHGEFHNRKKNGELFWESASISPIRDAEGTITHYVAVKEDITERKRLEAQLQREKDELGRAYADLKRLQSQLLQQEKMSSIGQLAAGVAHEINNPMGFIMSNLNTLRKYLDRLSGFIGLQDAALRDVAASPAPSHETMNRIAAERQARKIDFILEDAVNLLSESLDGAERVKRIVQDLKGFSRVDEAESTMADINAGIESTLNIVWNEIKYKATVHKEYGALPQTKCNPGQLNQVFMNILINAVQAIPETGEIRVRTWAERGSIFVAISDSGTGMPPEMVNRIFEPFFTTKEVGKGTGLGLSIAYDIVKKHGGDISVTSEAGQGTTFTIAIPVIEG